MNINRLNYIKGELQRILGESKMYPDFVDSSGKDLTEMGRLSKWCFELAEIWQKQSVEITPDCDSIHKKTHLNSDEVRCKKLRSFLQWIHCPSSEPCQFHEALYRQLSQKDSVFACVCDCRGIEYKKTKKWN